MKHTSGTLTIAGAGLAIALALTGCAAEVSDLDRAQARVASKEKAVAQAESDLAAASSAFCESGTDYVRALDRYGDVLTATAPTVGDVRTAGADLAAPADDVRADAEDAVAAQQELAVARQELAEAEAALAEAQGSPADTAETPEGESVSEPLVPPASVDRVRQAEADFSEAQAGVDDDTPLVQAAEQFNGAAVALELSWLRLLVDAGCATDEQRQRAEAAVSAYTAALQQELTAIGYDTGAIDGIYGPLTVQAVADLQEASGLPVTGTMDKATTEALRAALEQAGAAAAQSSVASTAALQQTLKLAGFWEGPVDGVWTPELTTALQELQVELGVAPTGTVDAATITAFEKALTELTAGSTPDPEPSESEEESESD